MAGGDGNGWVECRCGHRHWGRHGAAGLLLARPSPAPGATQPGEVEILLQLRAEWTHQGGTWGVPGGAGDSHESASEAALREAWEETGVDPGDLRVLGQVVATDHGDWSYTVVIATPRREIHPTTANTESDEVRWVSPAAVADLPLHPGFSASWPIVSRALDDTLGAEPRP